MTHIYESVSWTVISTAVLEWESIDMFDKILANILEPILTFVSLCVLISVDVTTYSTYANTIFNTDMKTNNDRKKIRIFKSF